MTVPEKKTNFLKMSLKKVKRIMIGIKYLIFTECFLNNKTTILRTSCKKKKNFVYILSYLIFPIMLLGTYYYYFHPEVGN